MKRLLLAAFMLGAVLVACAQAKDTTLNQYVGKYTFPEGSFVTSAEITLEGDVLTVNSSQGGSPLEKKSKDTFAMTAYEGGMIYFSRNADDKVAKVKVEVGDILIEGTKDGVTAWLNRNRYFDNHKQVQSR